VVRWVSSSLLHVIQVDLFIFIESALEEYKITYHLPQKSSNTALLGYLMKNDNYRQCVKTTLSRYPKPLRDKDVDSCTKVLYHELSKHAHGNMGQLVVMDTEHAMTEVAAIESVFCTLKKLQCFHFQVSIIIE
jgi:hypothetical protein